MNLSPQSEAIVRKLRLRQRIQCGSVVIGPLDDYVLLLLDVLIDQYENLNGRKGQDQAAALRTYFSQWLQATSPGGSATEDGGSGAVKSATISQPNDKTSATPADWRLVRIRCRSIRGIAPPEEEFAFDFHGESNLIYGPNGSGKSSLLGAVVWVLIGKALTDSLRPETEAAMYRAPGCKKAGAKLRDWPVVATLPEAASAESARPDCWGEIELKSSTTGQGLWLRRSYGEDLEFSTDASAWAVCPSLVQVGIAPLDLQLSLLAPTVFGRTTIEEAKDTRSLLSLMLGFDDLEQLGDLASNLARNRIILEKAEKAALDTKVAELKRDLAQLADSLPDDAPTKEEVVALAKSAKPSVDSIREAAKNVESALTAAEGKLAKIVGLRVDEGRAPTGIADQLAVALAKLEVGVWKMFPGLDSLRPEVAFSPSDDASSEERLVALAEKLDEFVQQARTSIRDRAKWWEREKAPGSRVGMLLTAAEFYDNDTAACPVCARRIEDQALKDHLCSLKDVDPKMRTELRTFFADLCAEVSKIVPPALAAVGKVVVRQAIISDWAKIEKDVLGKPFSQLATEYDPRIQEVCDNLEAVAVPEITLLPEGVDDEFRSAAADLLASVDQRFRALSLLDWGKAEAIRVAERLDRIVTAAEQDEAVSLYALLSKGKASANAVKPLALANRGLVQARKSQELIDASRESVRQLETLAAPLDIFKSLGKYAESQVHATFDAIRDATVANLKELYPGSATGLKTGRLKLGKGRDKSVESLLSNDTYEVPGQFFANAGLQRAVALSFYFALLQKHERGLGFILMDDPILSLDEEHRERWSARLLRPNLTGLQVVLATHQSQYLNNCKAHFSADRVVELNPRDRNQRVSWHPGDRLRRAQKQLETDWRTAPTTMRKFREDVLISLDAYSPDAFFSANALSASLKKYGGFVPPHPLAGRAQKQTVEIFQNPAVATVLDPGSHSKTEADVTKQMAEQCLEKLLKYQTTVDKELERLETERRRALRGAIIPASIIQFPSLPEEVTWSAGVEVRLIGAAAARSAPWVIDVSDEAERLNLLPGAGVLVSSDTLDPVARRGQWVLLAPEEVLPNDGDLVAANDADGNHYLRRIWSDAENWVLQSVNPVHPVPSILVAKKAAAARKIVGVVYEPFVSVSPSSRKILEWLYHAQFDPAKLEKWHAIQVEGDSLRPLAWPAQKVLVDEKYGALAEVRAGTLAVVETSSEAVGNVVKRVFPHANGWILVSPNPVDTIAPDVLSKLEINSIRRVCGVLFETANPAIAAWAGQRR